MKRFKFLSAFLLTIGIIFTFAGCGEKNAPNDNGSQSGSQPEDTESNSGKDDNTDTKIDGKILIAFFSRADENYSVGVIEKGNTQILAEMIREEVGGDLFHIERATPYPSVYSECTAEAQREKNANERPSLLNTTDISEYDVIFLGYPIWWGDLPMPVYTFIENQNWSSKTVIPFSTNEGSGLAGTVGTITAKCSGATISEALSMRGATAQNNQTQARQQVKAWLTRLNLI